MYEYHAYTVQCLYYGVVMHKTPESLMHQLVTRQRCNYWSGFSLSLQ